MLVTSFYAGLLGLWLILLSARVILARRSEQVSLGHGGQSNLERRIRAQGNFAEYVPLALILIGMLELGQVSLIVINGLCLLLLTGRLLHGWALSFTDGNSFGRIVGMVMTLTAIGLAALINVVRSLGGLITG